MCIKIFRKVSFGINVSYSMTKVLLKHLKLPLSVHSSTISVTRSESIVRTRNSSTEIGVQTDVRQNNGAGSEHSFVDEVTPSVSRKRKTSKEKYSKDVMEYLNSKDYLKTVLCCLPPKILKRRKVSPDALYAVDRDVASKCI
jgi:hypothetical protein